MHGRLMLSEVGDLGFRRGLMLSEVEDLGIPRGPRIFEVEDLEIPERGSFSEVDHPDFSGDPEMAIETPLRDRSSLRRSAPEL